MKQKREKKDKSKMLTHSVRVRLNEEQFNYFTKKAKELDWSLSPTIRELALKSKLNITCKTDQETKIQLRKIGVNINQVTRKVNQFHDKNEIKMQLEYLHKFIIEVQNTIKNIEK